MECGPTSSMGFGGILSWPELRDWEHEAGKVLDPWERVMLRRLSAEWAKESRRAEAPDADPPFKAAIFMTEERRAEVSRRLDELLGVKPQ
jgi:hypothetical protein